MSYPGEQQCLHGPWNYRTEGYDEKLILPNEETVLDYIPQEQAAVNLYRLLRERMSMSEAMIEVLYAAVGHKTTL